MSVFDDDASPINFARDVKVRLSPHVSLLVIGGLSALSWGVVAGIIMAVRAIL